MQEHKTLSRFINKVCAALIDGGPHWVEHVSAGWFRGQMKPGDLLHGYDILVNFLFRTYFARLTFTLRLDRSKHMYSIEKCHVLSLSLS